MAEPGRMGQTGAVSVSEPMVLRQENMAAYGRRIRMNRAEHLLTAGIEKSFEKHPFYSQDGKGENADILVKYFNPYGRGR